MHWTAPEEEDDLSQAAWAIAMNCGGICQTAESLTFVGPSFCGGAVDCAAANTLTNTTLSIRRARRMFAPDYSVSDSVLILGRRYCAVASEIFCGMEL